MNERLVLTRATSENYLFDQLKLEWDAQLQTDEDAPIDYYDVMMDHAEKITKETPQDSKYGIFILAPKDQLGNITAPFEGLVHINHKLPGTTAAEVRLVWNLIAPRYQFVDLDQKQFAKVTAGFLSGALNLCSNEMPAPSMKMYLGNAVDREHAEIVAAMLQQSTDEIDLDVKGNWLHITINQGI